jgi:hypothetical protein
LLLLCKSKHEALCAVSIFAVRFSSEKVGEDFKLEKSHQKAVSGWHLMERDLMISPKKENTQKMQKTGNFI